LKESPLGRRIVIVGPACAGKSTLAAEIAARLEMPHVELDALYWRPGWVGVSDAEFARRIDAATRDDAWIVDGHYERAWPWLWPRVETVIWLDLPLCTLLWRGFLRSLRRVRTGELLWGTNSENAWGQLKLWDRDRSLLAWTVTSYRSRRRAYLTATLDRRWSHIRFLRLCSQAEVKVFLDAIAPPALRSTR